MNKQDFIHKVNEKVKLIRVEQDFSQDKMAEILGISKKTLVEIEKGRSSFTWSGAICVVTLFEHSEIVRMTFGEDVKEIIKTIAFTNYQADYPTTLGGKVWWRLVSETNGFKIQQNILSQHYRILDSKDRRICSSYDFEYIKKRLTELEKIKLN
ncbi:MAG: family transcriptional regulator [Bacillales bacterium]|jgi:DNA-binding XRE family transcriptional regulator|nr:family transcriptional regulator [Bacillales bacterium]